MKRSYVIGVDIGGTNTDGVVVDATGEIVCAKKVTTTSPVDVGFAHVLNSLAQDFPNILGERSLQRICIGTTHAMNALLTQSNLDPVGLIRVVGQPPLIDAASDWPDLARTAILRGVVTVSGGFECDGRQSAVLDVNEVEAAIESLVSQGAKALAVVGAFSPLFPEQEHAVRDIANRICALPVTLSCELGGIGLIERENAALVNATLGSCVSNGFAKLQSIAREQGLACPLYLTQNNGTLLSVEEALKFPIKTIAAGPANSCVGAARLSGFSDAVVVDIGGTSTDVGVVTSGFVRRSFANANIGGIALNFAMPDVLSVGIGGGSMIHVAGACAQVGPQSLGAQTLTQSRAFGGDVTSLTDVAIGLGLVSIAGADRARVGLSPEVCERVIESIQARVQTLIDRMRGPRTELPVVAVGGGAQLGLLDSVVVPEYAGVANAYGAAQAEKSATIDVTVSLERREETMAQIEAEVIAAATKAGADPSRTRIVYKDVIPYSYISGNQARLIMTAAGPLLSKHIVNAPLEG